MRLLGVVVGALVCQLLVWAGAATAAEVDRPRQVLLLYGESRLQPAIVAADAAFRSTVSSGLGAPVNFNTEFLDLPPTSSAVYERRLWDMLRLKYQDVHFDLVVTLQIRALRFALDSRAELAHGTPIVFMAVTSVGGLELPRDVSGVQMSGDWIDTLGAALRLQPETQRVVVVGGTAALDKTLLASVRASFAESPAHLEFTYVTDLPLDAVATKLATLPDQTIVLLVSFLQDSTGRSISTVEALERLVERSRVPIYGLSSVLMGHGIVGGRLVDFEKQGIMAGELGLRVLRGEKLGPGDIVTQNTNAFMFDARQLRRWGLVRESNERPPRDPEK